MRVDWVNVEQHVADYFFHTQLWTDRQVIQSFPGLEVLIGVPLPQQLSVVMNL